MRSHTLFAYYVVTFWNDFRMLILLFLFVQIYRESETHSENEHSRLLPIPSFSLHTLGLDYHIPVKAWTKNQKYKSIPRTKYTKEDFVRKCLRQMKSVISLKMNEVNATEIYFRRIRFNRALPGLEMIKKTTGYKSFSHNSRQTNKNRGCRHYCCYGQERTMKEK